MAPPVFAGVDVAKYQGRIDWSVLAPQCAVVSIKGTEDAQFRGHPYEVDETFLYNWTEARARGVRWRLYNHFPGNSPIDEQVAQITATLTAAGGPRLRANEGIALDVEPDPGAGISSLDPGFVVELAAEISSTFVRPAVMNYQGFFQPSWRALLDAGHPWWLPWPHAQLGIDSRGKHWFGPEVAALVSAWQYGQDHVDGVPALVDVNAVLAPAALDRVCGIPPAPPPGPTQEEDDMPQVRKASDGSIWLAVIAPDGNPALVPTDGEGWFVYGVMGYREDGSGPAVPVMDDGTYSTARKLSQADWDRLAAAYGGTADAPGAYDGVLTAELRLTRATG